jgi:hypothetical protein
VPVAFGNDVSTLTWIDASGTIVGQAAGNDPGG